MRLSIVIPTLNEAEFLARTVERARVAAPDAEILVVDGGSTDGTPDLARSLECVVVESDAGRARQMRAGAETATGDTLLFLHADTMLHSDAAGAMEAAIGRGCIGGAFRIRLDAPFPMFRLLEVWINQRSRLTGSFTGDQGFFVTRAACDAAGGMPDLPLLEDVIFPKRLRRIGPLCLLDSEVTSSARRWQRFGFWWTTWTYFSVRLMYALGFSVPRIAEYYRKRFSAADPRRPAALLCVFAKLPTPGLVKTRLTDAISEEDAAAACQSLCDHVVAVAHAALEDHVRLAVWHDPPEAAEHFRNRYPQLDAVAPQSGSDLGARMRECMQRGLTEGHDRVVIVGSDCFDLTPAILRQALAVLDAHDTIIGPARDGGYYLVGMRGDHTAIFDGIPWSTPDVLELTYQRIRDLELSCFTLPELSDVDTVEDLRRALAAGLQVDLPSLKPVSG